MTFQKYRAIFTRTQLTFYNSEISYNMFVAQIHIICMCVCAGVTVTRRLWVRFPDEGMNYYLLKSHFFALASRQKPDFEFRHSTGNVSKNLTESGDWSVLTLGSLCLLCCERDTVWSRFICFILLMFVATVEQQTDGRSELRCMT